MKSAFLNAETIEAAHEAYLTRWHLQPVKDAWNGRKPSLAQFKKRFGKEFEARQRKLAKAEGTSTVLLDREVEAVQDVAESVIERLHAILGRTSAISAPAIAELDEDDDEFEDEATDDGAPDLLAALRETINGKTTTAKTTSTTPKGPKAPLTVKPENAGKTPTVDQLYFLLHRAIDEGKDYVAIPVRRDHAGAVISQIKANNKTVEDALRAWRRSRVAA